MEVAGAPSGEVVSRAATPQWGLPVALGLTALVDLTPAGANVRIGKPLPKSS